MKTEPSSAAASPQAGFTLIEVLFAFIILAFGLLALEALGIHASRLTARAAYQSDYVALATDSLESYTSQLLANTNPGNRSGVVNGATVNITVATAGTLRTVTVTVIPPATRVLTQRDSIRISANVYVDNPNA